MIVLSEWTKLLPFSIIKPIAEKHCECIVINGRKYVMPYDGVLIETEQSKIDREIDRLHR